MSKKFSEPTEADEMLLTAAMAQYRPELVAAKARVGLIMVQAVRDQHGQKLGPALSHHGHSALARVRLVSDRDRVHTPFDVLIEIDADHWELEGGQDPKQRAALLHHELLHVEVKRNRNNDVLRDDQDRPRIDPG